MTVKTQSAVDNPAAFIALFAVFSLFVGTWYLIKNRRKVRKWWRKTTRKKEFWGYVLAGFLFVGFSAYFIFLGNRY